MRDEAAIPVLTYLGWSGFILEFPGTAPVIIDPPAADAIAPDRDIILLITHGHPEHISGAAKWLSDPARRNTAQVVASSGVCRYLKKRAKTGPNDRFYPVREGGKLEFPGLRIDMFRCLHMPLLPPEKGGAMTRLRQLAGHPGLTLSIIMSALRGPFPGPLLGFRLRPASGPAVLFWGEGMNRGAGLDAIRGTASRLPAQLLIAAVEPEDERLFPNLVAATGVNDVLAYEAHMPWRQAFGMGWADLGALAPALASLGINALRASPGMPLALSGE